MAIAKQAKYQWLGEKQQKWEESRRSPKDHGQAQIVAEKLGRRFCLAMRVVSEKEAILQVAVGRQVSFLSSGMRSRIHPESDGHRC